MRRTMSKILSFTLLLSIISIFCSCSNKVPPKIEDGKEIIIYNLNYEPPTIDPQLAATDAGMIVDGMCMEGLLGYGQKNGEIIPGISDKWNVSKDGKMWIFHIRDNAKWSNGEAITANDFVYGIKRALYPSLGSQYSYLLYDIQNAKKYSEEKILDFNDVGIKALDNSTIQIKLNKPVPYFEKIMALPVTFPVNEKFQNKLQALFSIGNTYDPSKLLYNGPYIIKNWIPQSKYKFVKNPNYWNSNSIKLDIINFVMIPNHKAISNEYRKGTIDMTKIYDDQLKEYKNSPDLHKLSSGAVWYLQFNVNNILFKNKKVRQAISMAIDRKSLCENIRDDGCTPAYSYIPPEITGGKVNGKIVTFRERFNIKYCSFNSDEAKKLFNEGLNELNLNLDDLNSEINKPNGSPITLLCDDNISSVRDASYFKNQIKNILNLDIKINSIDSQSRFFNIEQKTYDFAYAGWSPDFNDPVTFLGLWTTASGNNTTNWSNTEYDTLIKKSNSNMNSDERMDELSNAEKILMNDMPIIPLYYSVDLWLIRPWIKNYVIRSTGIDVSFNWAYIET